MVIKNLTEKIWLPANFQKKNQLYRFGDSNLLMGNQLYLKPLILIGFQHLTLNLRYELVAILWAESAASRYNQRKQHWENKTFDDYCNENNDQIKQNTEPKEVQTTQTGSRLKSFLWILNRKKKLIQETQ